MGKLEIGDIKIEVYLWNHDEPKEEVGLDFLLNKNIWCHAKNIEAFESLLIDSAHCFWHEEDDYTLTSKGYIWTYPGQKLVEKSVCVLPESFKERNVEKCSGLCSDFVLNYLHLSDIIV